MWWSYYAANHGKDLYDKEGGVLKCSARQYVRDHGTREHNPIKDINDLVTFGRVHLSRPRGSLVQRRHFFKFDEKIPEPVDAGMVKGSSKLYSYRVRGSKKSNVVEAREFACFCDKCLGFRPCKRPSGTWRATPAGYVVETESDKETDE